jgi:hypothetical protein
MPVLLFRRYLDAAQPAVIEVAGPLYGLVRGFAADRQRDDE